MDRGRPTIETTRLAFSDREALDSPVSPPTATEGSSDDYIGDIVSPLARTVSYDSDDMRRS